MKLFKLNERGVAHYLVGILVVAFIGAAGTYVITNSHAATPNSVELTQTTSSVKGSVAGDFVQQENTQWPSQQNIAYIGVDVTQTKVAKVKKVDFYLYTT